MSSKDNQGRTDAFGRPVQPAHLHDARRFEPGDDERMQQDFMAGTVFAAGAGVAFPEGGDGPPMMKSMFVIFLNDDDTTYGPAPQLREAFRLLDEHGAVALHDLLPIGTSWAGLGGEQPLVKLKLEFQGPLSGSTAVVLLAEQYAQIWQHIVDGGMIGLTTQARLEKATSRPGASFTDAMEACVLVGIKASPVLDQLMGAYGWPRG